MAAPPRPGRVARGPTTSLYTLCTNLPALAPPCAARRAAAVAYSFSTKAVMALIRAYIDIINNPQQFGELGVRFAATCCRALHSLLQNAPALLQDEVSRNPPQTLLLPLFAFFEAKVPTLLQDDRSGTRMPLLQALVCFSTLAIADVPRAFAAFAGRILKPIVDLAVQRGQANLDTRLTAIHFLRLTLACRRITAAELKMIHDDVTNPDAIAYKDQSGRPIQRHNQYLLCSYGMWSFTQLAVGVFRALHPPGAADAKGTPPPEQDAPAGRAAKRPRTAPSCKYRIVLDGVRSASLEDKRYWLQMLYGLVHDPAHFGEPLRARYTESERAVVLELVKAATSAVAETQDEDVHVWAMESLSSLCQSLPSNVVQTAEWSAAWHGAWVGAVGCLRTPNIKQREMHRVFSLLRTLFQTGAVDRERVLADRSTDPTSQTNFKKDGGIDRIRLLVNIVSTRPRHRMGTVSEKQLVDYLLTPNTPDGAWPTTRTIAQGLAASITGVSASPIDRPQHMRHATDLVEYTEEQLGADIELATIHDRCTYSPFLGATPVQSRGGAGYRGPRQQAQARARQRPCAWKGKESVSTARWPIFPPPPRGGIDTAADELNDAVVLSLDDKCQEHTDQLLANFSDRFKSKPESEWVGVMRAAFVFSVANQVLFLLRTPRGDPIKAESVALLRKSTDALALALVAVLDKFKAACKKNSAALEQSDWTGIGQMVGTLAQGICVQDALSQWRLPHHDDSWNRLPSQALLLDFARYMGDHIPQILAKVAKTASALVSSMSQKTCADSDSEDQMGDGDGDDGFGAVRTAGSSVSRSDLGSNNAKITAILKCIDFLHWQSRLEIVEPSIGMVATDQIIRQLDLGPAARGLPQISLALARSVLHVGVQGDGYLSDGDLPWMQVQIKRRKLTTKYVDSSIELLTQCFFSVKLNPDLPAAVLDVVSSFARVYCQPAAELETSSVNEFKAQCWAKWMKTLRTPKKPWSAPPATRVAMCTCLVHFQAADPAGDWWLDGDDEEADGGSLLNFLEEFDSSLSHVVAVEAAAKIADAIAVLDEDSCKGFVEDIKDICEERIDAWDEFDQVLDGDEVNENLIALALLEQRAIGAMLILGEAAKVYPPVQRTVVMLLSRHASPGNAVSPVVSRIIGQIAASIGASPSEYFKGQVLQGVVADWLNEELDKCTPDQLAAGDIYKTTLVKFPAHLIAPIDVAAQPCRAPETLLYPATIPASSRLQKDFTKFVVQHMDTIMPTAVRIFISKSTRLDIIDAWMKCFARIVNNTVPNLVEAHFPRILGWTLYHAVGEETRRRYSEFLDKYVPTFEGAEWSKLRLTRVLVELITYADTAPEDYISLGGEDDSQSQGQASGSAIDKKTLGDVLSYTKSHFCAILNKYESVGDFLLAKHGAQGILLHLSIVLANSRQTCDQVAVFKVFSHVVQNILKLPARLEPSKPAFPKSHYLRSVVGTLVRTITEFSNLLEQSCKVLHTLCKSALRFMPKEFASLVHVIVSALLKDAPTTDTDERPAANMWRESCALEILHDLVDYAGNRHIKAELQNLTPFPCGGTFESIRAKHEKIRGETSLADDLDHFLKSSVKQKTSTSQLLELTYLRDTLRSEASKQDMQLGVVREKMPEVLGVLLAQCAASDDKCRELIGACLGELGAFNLDTVALPSNTARAGAGNKALSCSITAAEVLAPAAEAYLLDMDAAVVEAAAVSFNALLRLTDAKRDVLKLVDAESPLCEELPWLQQTHSAICAEAQKCHTHSKSAGLYNWEVVWNPATASSYTEWIQRVTHKLISFGADGNAGESVFTALLPLCHRRSDFCKTLLPHVVLAVLKQDPDGSRREELSRTFKTFFAATAAAAKTDTIQKDCALTMIHIVNALRQCEMETSVSRRSGHAKKKSRTSSGGASTCTHWESLSWLDLDFLDVAKTASACSAYFTTMFYAEVWWEKQADQGGLIDDLRAQGRSVVVEASRGIGEPDTIHGILHAALETDSLVHLLR